MFGSNIESKVNRVRDLVPEALEALCQDGSGGTGLPINSGHSNFRIHREEFSVIFARPWGGSTAFLSSMAVQLSVKKDIPVAYFTLDLSRDILVQRMLCLYSGEKFCPLTANRNMPRLTAAAGALSEAPLYVLEGKFDLDGLERSIRRLVRERKIQFFAVDTIDQVGEFYELDSFSKRAERERICARLKKLARSLDVAITAIIKIDSDPGNLGTKKGDLSEPNVHLIFRKEGNVARFAENVMVLNILFRDISGHLYVKSPRMAGMECVQLRYDQGSLRCSFTGDNDV